MTILGADAVGPSRRRRIIVLGYIVRGPLGGMAWHHLQYVMGLAKLGHDVHFLEDSGDTPWCCYDPSRGVTDSDPTFGLAFAANAFTLVDLPERWAYYDAHTSRWHGPASGRVKLICDEADIVLNLSGANPIRRWLEHVPVRVLVDTDPAFTQIRNLTDPFRRERALCHTAFFSYGENIGRGSTIPDDGFRWHATRQPIVLDAWQVHPGPRHGKFTTVMQWNSYTAPEHENRRFGMKSESFAPYLDLPRTIGREFELAVGGAAPYGMLREHGWLVRDPNRLIPDPQSFRRFVQHSKAEFTVAKEAYVITRSGWFSDRSATYLASGRPVVTQGTGWNDGNPVDGGLLTFNDPAEAVLAIDAVCRRYDHHCLMARRVAEDYFDARHVLTSLVETATDGARDREVS